MTHPGAHYPRLQSEGFRLIPWSISRKSLNPIRELRSLLEVVQAYRRERPDLVHHIALKPIVFGSFAARLCGGVPAVNSVTGLGPLFTTPRVLYVALRLLLVGLLRFCLAPKNASLITQNEDDRDLLCHLGVSEPRKASVIFGFGVDTDNYFVPHSRCAGPVVVTLPARMLWEKGVREFVDAAAELRTRNVAARMVLVGSPDHNNRGSISEEQLKRWSRSGIVEWWGHCDDMKEILSLSDIVCLPSYREGIPRILIEAASCARAIVTTNAPGCSAVVQHGVNGFLVPTKDSKALADALSVLIHDPERRAAMGLAGRALAIEKFSERITLPKMMRAYDQSLGVSWRNASRPIDREFKLAANKHNFSR